MNFIQIISSLFIGYIFGCFQTSYFISNIVSNKDIREVGSGNAGASNVTSELGWKYGILTGILDMLKAYIPTKLILFIFPETSSPIEIMVVAGTGAILGHIYPFFLDFRGGKGIACYIGMLIAINWVIGFAVIVGLIFLTLITDYISIGSISLYIIIPILIYMSNYYSKIVMFCAVFLFIVGMIKHWINIQRIISGEEIGFRTVYNKNKGS